MDGIENSGPQNDPMNQSSKIIQEKPAIEPPNPILKSKIQQILRDKSKTFKEKVQDLTADNDAHEEIVKALKKQSLYNRKLVLCTKVHAVDPDQRNDFFFELEYKDLQELFSQFGKLDRMFFRRTAASHMEAITIFKDNVNAFIAQKLLDGFRMTEPDVLLDIKFVQEKEEEEENCNVLRLKDLSLKESQELKENSHSSNQYHDENEVMVELRMGDPSHNYGEKQDYVYLIVHAKTAEKYTKAASLSMELMANLFEEYKLFCDEKYIPVDYDTRIKKYEYVQGDCPLIFTEEKKSKTEGPAMIQEKSEQQQQQQQIQQQQQPQQ